MTTFEEWRITGDPGEGYPPYDHTFSPILGRTDDIEREARGFIALIERCGGWPDGPHLSRRTVTVTDWEDDDVRPSAERISAADIADVAAIVYAPNRLDEYATCAHCGDLAELAGGLCETCFENPDAGMVGP